MKYKLSNNFSNSIHLNNNSNSNSSNSSNSSSINVPPNPVSPVNNNITNANLNEHGFNSSSNNNSNSESLNAESRANRCRVCGKTYARPSTLKTHMRTHSVGFIIKNLVMF